MKQIIITVPDDDRTHAEYVRLVSDQLGQGYLSGHVDNETYWEYA